MHNGKYLRHTAASCAFHLQTIISWLLNNSCTEKAQLFTESVASQCRVETVRRKGQAESAARQGNKTQGGDRKGESNDSPEIPQ